MKQSTLYSTEKYRVNGGLYSQTWDYLQIKDYVVDECVETFIYSSHDYIFNIRDHIEETHTSTRK